MMTRLFIMQLAHQDNWPLFHMERNEEKPTKDAGRRIEQEKVADNARHHARINARINSCPPSVTFLTVRS